MDIKLYYTEKGAGNALILLHGNGEDGSYFSAQIDRFSKFYRVIAVDTRGHGKSPRGTAPFTLDQFADDLYHFMLSENIVAADILGFSDGGNIAILFALKHPEMVHRLILNGANLYPGGLCLPVRIADRAGLWLCSFMAKRSEKAAHRAALLRLMTDEPHIDVRSLARLKMPVLVIAGSHDMIKRSHTALIAQSIPGAKLCILPGKHSVAADSPEAFNQVAEDFLLKKIK